MTLMTDEIEWYPLPEVDDIHAGLTSTSSQGRHFTTPHQASLNYSTPPSSSYASFKSCRKGSPSSASFKTARTSLRKGSSSASFKTAKASVGKGSSTASFKTAKASVGEGSSSVSFKTAKASVGKGSSSVSFKTAKASVGKGSSTASFKTAKASVGEGSSSASFITARTSGSVPAFKSTSSIRETGIQTTPSLAFSISSSHDGFHTPTESLETKTNPTPPQRLSQLTLQEALHVLRPDFVHRSEKRQKELLKNRELSLYHNLCGTKTGITTTNCHHHRHCPVSSSSSSRNGNGEKCVRGPQFIHVDVTGNRPKMTPHEMYQNSKKYWCKLPEVKQQEEERRRQSEAVANRHRKKIYQKKILEQMRKQRK